MRTLNGRFATPQKTVTQKLFPVKIMILSIAFTWGMSVSPSVYQVMAEGANNAKLDEQPLATTTPSATPTPTPIWVPATTQKEDIINEITRVFGEDAPEAFNILFCENRTLNPNAINHNRNGSVDRGLFQINSIHAGAEMFDIHKNIAMAYKIFKSSGWKAWSCSHRIGVTPYYLR